MSLRCMLSFATQSNRQTPNRGTQIPFPLSMRWPLTYWRWLFAPNPKPFAPGNDMSAEVARGAYFVNSLGHCGECHTPRNMFLQLKAVNRDGGSSYLSGAMIETYYAPSLRTAGVGSLSEWSDVELAEFLRSGVNTHGISFGLMSDVIAHSSQYMTDPDALDAARYLKTLTSPPAAKFAYDTKSHSALLEGDASAKGALLYLNNCAACHRPDEQGYERVFPPLAGNAVVLAERPESVMSIILRGASTPRTNPTPAQFTMPPFAWRL
jgi:mono/diheme cytochrome c family protein